MKDPIDKWINDNPMKANCIYPTLAIISMMGIMFIGMTTINFFVGGE